MPRRAAEDCVLHGRCLRRLKEPTVVQLQQSSTASQQCIHKQNEHQSHQTDNAVLFPRRLAQRLQKRKNGFLMRSSNKNAICLLSSTVALKISGAATTVLPSRYAAVTEFIILIRCTMEESFFITENNPKCPTPSVTHFCKRQFHPVKYAIVEFSAF